MPQYEAGSDGKCFNIRQGVRGRSNNGKSDLLASLLLASLTTSILLRFFIIVIFSSSKVVTFSGLSLSRAATLAKCPKTALLLTTRL